MSVIAVYKPTGVTVTYMRTHSQSSSPIQSRKVKVSTSKCKLQEVAVCLPVLKKRKKNAFKNFIQKDFLSLTYVQFYAPTLTYIFFLPLPISSLLEYIQLVDREM